MNEMVPRTLSVKTIQIPMLHSRPTVTLASTNNDKDSKVVMQSSVFEKCRSLARGFDSRNPHSLYHKPFQLFILSSFFFWFFFCEIDSVTISTRQTIHLFLYSIYIFCLSLSALESSPTLKLIIKPSNRPVKGKKFVLKLVPRLATVPNFMGVILTTPICWFPR